MKHFYTIFATKIAISILAACLVCIACNSDRKSTSSTVENQEPDPSSELVFAVSIDGKILGPIKEPDSLLNVQEAAFNKARIYYLQNLENVKGYLVYGNQCIRNGMVENGIQILTKGIDKFPNTGDLYMLRAEACIAGRQFKTAIDDLWKAGKAIESQSVSLGILNLSPEETKLAENLHYRVYKNMGLAFQHSNDLSNAQKMFEVVGDFATNPDLYCMAYYWQYQCYMRVGRKEDAVGILASISESMNIMPQTKPYLDALLFYKGVLRAKELVDVNFKPLNSEEAKPWLIKMYALGVQNLIEMNNVRADEIFQVILASGYWNQPAYIAAEADRARLKGVIYKEAEQINLSQKNKKTNAPK